MDEIELRLRQVGALRDQYQFMWPVWALTFLVCLVIPVLATIYGAGTLPFDSPILIGSLVVIGGLMIWTGVYLFGMARWQLGYFQLKKLAEDVDVRDLFKMAKGESEVAEVVCIMESRIRKYSEPEELFLHYQVLRVGFEKALEIFPTRREIELVEKAVSMEARIRETIFPSRRRVLIIVLFLIVYLVAFFVYLSESLGPPRGSTWHLVFFICLAMTPQLFGIFLHVRRYQVRKKLLARADVENDDEEDFVRSLMLR